MAEKANNDINLRTEDVIEILTTPPKWLHRWGISVIFIAILMFVLFSNFISYPDVLTSKATVTSLNPPINLVARVNGKLVDLLVKNNEAVRENQILAVVENTANYANIITLKSTIDLLSAKIKGTDAVPTFDFNDSFQVGEITPSYLQFIKSYENYKLFFKINSHQKEIAELNKELINYNILLTKYESQEKLQNEELSLSEKDYGRDIGLSREGIISLRDFDNKKKEIIRGKSAAEAQKIAITTVKITINNIEKSKLRLQIEYSEQMNKLKSELEQALKNLHATIDTWKQDYLFIAPVNGNVSFFNFWTVNQNIKTGEEVFSVVPHGDRKLIAKLILPLQNSGKVKLGQLVKIKLDNYSYIENGILDGKINNISMVSSNGNYLIDVDLPNGLLTSYNKSLIYKNEMTGTGEIITENLSLFERIFNKFRSILRSK